MLEIFEIFSKNISQILKQKLEGQTLEDIKTLEEIRIRSNGIISLKFNSKQEILNQKVTYQEIIETIQRMCENSIYSYQNEIKNGYITLKGGHRVGIAGNCVIENGKVINIKYISSINFRIARQVIGCSKPAIKYILNPEKKTINNTLIVSPPGVGKTTILRDLIRNVSNGMEEINFEGMNVGLVDERGEIAALYKGIPQNEVGIRTDILENIPKPIGIKMLIRSMAPQVIAADEIGTVEDVEAIKEAICMGVKGIFTAHGENQIDIEKNPVLKSLINESIIERIIFLKLNNGERTISIQEKAS